jgi:Zn finger protein HypA/HybF involved in hydrogenase expression
MLEEEGKLSSADCTEKDHDWVLNDKSFGVCKKCGAKKQFLFQGREWRKRKVVIGKKSHSQTD